MKRKDRKLEDIFNEYVKTEKPSPSLLQPALFILRENKIAKQKRNKRIFLAIFTPSATAFVLLILFLFPQMNKVSNKNTSQNNVQFYNFNQLSKEKSSLEEIENYNINLPSFTEISNESFTIFYKKEEKLPVLLLYKFRNYQDEHIDEVKIYVELTNQISKDLLSLYSNLPLLELNGFNYNGYTDFVDGEYVSQAYLLGSSRKIYLEIMSPRDDNILDYYIEKVKNI